MKARRHRLPLPLALVALTLGVGGLAPLAATAPAAAGGPNAKIEVTTTADVVDAGDEQTSLREAFDQANANPGDDTIALTTDPADGRYEVAGCDEGPATGEDANAFGDFDHTDGAALTIEGQDNVIAGLCDRAVDDLGTGLLTLRDVTIEDSRIPFPTGGNGGGVRAAGDVVGEGLVLRHDGAASGSGGGIHAEGSVDLRDAVVAQNTARGGAGISADFVRLTDSVLRSNEALGAGGILSVHGVEIVGSRIRANRAYGNHGSAACCGDAGAIGSGGLVRIDDSEVVGNEGTGTGGAIDASSVTVRDSTVAGNRTGAAGGAIFSEGVVRIVRSTVRQNQVGYFGGGVRAQRAIIVASTFSGNGAIYGGGVWAEDDVTLTDSTFSANVAHSGGALGGRGGAVFSNEGAVSLLRSTVVHNQGGKGANVRHGGLLVSRASIIGRAVGGVGCWGPGGTVSHGFNVTDPSAQCGFAAGGDRVIMVGIALGPLADNGGPTFTRLPPDENLSNISLAACSDHPDQRGQPRPQGARCEAGSVEVP